MAATAKNKIHLRIITPEELKVDESADMVIMRCVNGDLGVLPGHCNYSAALGDGVLRIINGNSERKLAVLGGIAEIKNDVVTIVTNNAESPEEIDIKVAQDDRERAERRIKEKSGDLRIQSHQVLLRRALVRIEVSSYPIINKATGENEDEQSDS